MSDTQSIPGILSNLHYARARHDGIAKQLLASAMKIAGLEVDMRNARRASDDTRPLEQIGDLNCYPHEWNGDIGNEQMYCSKPGCGARVDSVYTYTEEGGLVLTKTMSKATGSIPQFGPEGDYDADAAIARYLVDGSADALLKNMKRALAEDAGASFGRFLARPEFIPGIDCTTENEGDPNCSHEWQDDGDNLQLVCTKCPARHDVMFTAKPMVDPGLPLFLQDEVDHMLGVGKPGGLLSSVDLSKDSDDSRANDWVQQG